LYFTLFVLVKRNVTRNGNLNQIGKNIIVIGGGISGLSTAFWLRQKGYEVTVLECDARAGGVIRSERIKGYTIDHAANCLMNFLPEVNHLIETVGLTGEQVFRKQGANKRYLLKQGRPQAVPLTPKEIFTSSFWPWSAKLRMVMEPLIPASSPDAEETVAGFIRRRFGREFLEQAIDPFVAGTLSGDPERTCVQSAMPKFYGLEQKHGSVIRGAIANKLAGIRTRCPVQMSSFRTGMEALPMAIARYLGDRVLTGARVNSIERIGQRWVVTAVYAGSMMQIEADAVVTAVPAQAAAQLLTPLSDLLADQLRGIVYAPMGVLTLGFRVQDIAHPLDGIGCLVPGRENRKLLGSLWNSSLFAHRAPEGRVLLTCYLGGMRNSEMLKHDDQRLTDLAMSDLGKMLGIKGEPEFVRLIRHERGLPQYHLGHQQRLATMNEQLSLLPGLYLTGNYIDGVSVRDRIARGKQLAERIFAEIPGRAGLSLVADKAGECSEMGELKQHRQIRSGVL